MGRSANCHRARAYQCHPSCVRTRTPSGGPAALELGYDSAVRVAAILATAIGALAIGCAREPVEELCPDIAVGDLVVTEVRGPQTPSDDLGPWVELYNASGRTIDLIGTKVRFRRKDGSSEVQVLVRENLDVAAGAYVVLGLFDNAMKPTYVDYGFAGDFTEAWLAAAAVDVETCGLQVDRATYDALPRQGTFSLTGAMPPSGSANDDLRMWCTDATMNAATFPGSPQKPNLACP